MGAVVLCCRVAADLGGAGKGEGSRGSRTAGERWGLGVALWRRCGRDRWERERARDGDRVEGIGVARVMELVGRLGLRGQRWGGPREAQVGCVWPEVQLGLNGLLGTLSPTQKRKKQR